MDIDDQQNTDHETVEEEREEHHDQELEDRDSDYFNEEAYEQTIDVFEWAIEDEIEADIQWIEDEVSEVEYDAQRDYDLGFRYNEDFLHDGHQIRDYQWFANFLFVAVPWSIFVFVLQWVQFVNIEK